MCFDKFPEPFRNSAMVSRDDGGVGDRQAERPPEQDDDSVPIGEAADRRRLREGSKKPEARVVPFQELCDDENAEARDQDATSNQFGSLELPQARESALVEGRCGRRLLTSD